jgi:hypothetical protein
MKEKAYKKKVQVNGNYRQRGHKRVWDTFLSIIGKREFNEKSM